MKKTILFVTMAAALVVGMLQVSCRSDRRPADVLDAPQMVAFLTDAYLLEGFYAIETQYRYDAMTPEVLRAYDDILLKHGITREQVEHSFDYYTAHPDLYATIQDSVITHLDRVHSSDTTSHSHANDLHVVM